MNSHIASTILLTTFSMLSVTQVDTRIWVSHQKVSDFDCISQPHAERILGQSAKRIESTTEEKGNVVEHKCTYRATSSEPNTNKIGNLYYMFETYHNAESAHVVYANIVESNRQQEGQQNLTGVGDEGWFHSDQQNFQMIIFRKGNKMVRIKVNKITRFTSEDQLRKVANDLALAM